ncbi:hypothetical protein [Flavisphingomonas formosensis]|uniref:hypothetical protein n=1 Tax=Flavisphingomonas formosensis TaxID=861534 RepID=UPI0038CD7CC3
MFRLPAEVAEIAFHNKALVYDLLFKAASDTMPIAADRSILARASASPPSCIPGARR